MPEKTDQHAFSFQRYLPGKAPAPRLRPLALRLSG